MAIKNYDDLLNDVKMHNGIRAYAMYVLRDVHGAGKLGTTVIQNISKELSLKGLGHYGPLKLNQWEKVKLYDKGAMMGKIIEALEDDSSQSEHFLQQVSDAKERTKAIDKLKEIVADL